MNRVQLPGLTPKQRILTLIPGLTLVTVADKALHAWLEVGSLSGPANASRPW